MADEVEWPTEGLGRLRDRLIDNTQLVPSRIALGTGTTDTTLTTVAMDTQVNVGAIDTYDKEGNDSVTFTRTLGTSEANGNAITEIGIDDGTNDNLFARQTGTAVNKTSSVILRLEMQVTLANKA